MMEGSMNHSSMNETHTSSEEESGWTSYFEDFFNNHREKQEEEEDSLCSGCFGTSSMVSDAASFPTWKSSSHHHHHHHNDNNNNNHGVFASSYSSIGASASPKIPNRLTFKKTRGREISHHDDSLEDTASSPVNSPKVSDLRPAALINSRKPSDHFNSSLGKGVSLEHYEGVLETDNERCEMNCSVNNNNHCTDLKKRGLCLVPLSMLVNYPG